MARFTRYCPEYMEDAFREHGVDVSEILFAIHTDMGADGAHADTYTAVTRDALLILTGEEIVTRMDGARRIVAKFASRSFESIPMEGIKELTNDRLVATGQLCAVSDDDAARALLLYSVGFLGDADRLAQVVKNIKAGAPALRDVSVDTNRFCPKCGRRYPESGHARCPNCMDQRSITLRLMGFFKHYQRKVLVVLAVMTLGSAVSILTPQIGSRMLFDEVLTPGGSYFAMLLPFVALIFLVRAVNSGLNMLYGFVLARTVPWIVYDLKMRIFEAMQRLSVGFYTSKRTGALMNRINRDANNIYWFFVDGFPYLIVNGLTFAGVLTLMCLMSVKLAAVVMIVLPLSIVFFRILWGFFKRFHHKNFVYGAQLNSMLSDSINGQRVIKAYAREDAEAQRFSAVGGKQAGIDVKMNNAAFTAFPLIYLFMFLGQVVVTMVGGVMVVEGELSLGSFLTFIAYLQMLYGPLEFMSWVSNWWARCVDSAQRVFEIIDAKPDITEPEHPADVKGIRGDIMVKNARFEYDPATPVLKGLDLTVESGKMLGIVGKTGAGKSTLANLIARLYDVNEGEITIDGINVKEWPLTMLRDGIGIVSQDIYLFIGSIADNIRYAQPGASMEDVIRAAKAAAAHEFIMKLPDGYETRVGAGGQDLSGGEKQRLSIARTILQNPKILILDEATAAMDTETEAAIQASLAALSKNRTTIAIAHRLSTLRDADSLAVIEDGKVIETGTHRELMTKMGAYFKLYKLQMEGLKVINMDAE
ncbi:MAG: ABC transporter ATP-binding protein/permease [Oscillospiraceae bacterium]|jgi:ATP-binding cassette subfamily B protein|nr:ABC transporter ATP-binding protein/permease [Oscillospiraceae bacterium]